jgi:class 3 adenylate cyclase
MFTALYTEVGSGPAKGWILGALYKAEEFGAALDQTRIVLYAALVALVVGAVLSFAVGRMLGRPLIRLAHAAAALHQLEFASTDKLPRSRLKELDDVNQAFNGSLGALNAFAKYVPRQLVSRLIEEGMTEARNIELREMTIVFTDLAGFTGMASHLSAEETAAYLNGYFETVSQAITERQGTIDKFLGDGVMAFWGAPADQPDHAAMAIAAVKALADRIAAEPDASMRVRVGVHTGKVVVGDIGSAARMNYTVIGDAVNVAARLQEYGKQVDPEARVIVLASGDTMAQLPEGVSATSLGPIQLRGRTEPLSVFRIA